LIADQSQTGKSERTVGYRSYLLGVLLVILAFNFVDRLALGLLLQNIKVDLSLSDTQLGLLSGVAFALFYSLLGIPIARWADRGNRITIIASTALLWSVAVGLCGMVASFAQLLAARVLAGIGEAGCVPPAHSLIADYFTRAERPRAVSIYMLGGPLSTLMGFFFAGWFNQIYGWRATFVCLAIPGLALGVLAKATLKEPRGEYSKPIVPADTSFAAEASLREVCVTLWRLGTFRHLLCCFSVLYFFGFGILQWQPAFFMRSYGMRSGEVGTWFALIYGFGGIFGTWWGGRWASRWAAGDEGLQLRAMTLTYSAVGVFSTFIYLTHNRYVAFGLMAVVGVGGAMANGPLFATIQTLVPQRMRAVSIATVYLFANLVGLGLGPLAAGALSDALRHLFGAESLRYALLALSPGYIWGGWHLWLASKTVAFDLARLDGSSRGYS
jgi:predicted MFS family arabinose efflux permease